VKDIAALATESNQSGKLNFPATNPVSKHNIRYNTLYLSLHLTWTGTLHKSVVVVLVVVVTIYYHDCIVVQETWLLLHF